MTEKWKRLTYQDLAEVLAQDEIDKLNEYSLSADIQDICQAQLDSVANAFRYAWYSKGYNVDERPAYVPNGYKMFVLNIARVEIWSRFPNSSNIGIDDIRKQLYNDAKELLKDPYIGVPDPDYSDDPELSGKVPSNGDYALTIPFQKMLSMPYEYGFPKVYGKFYASKDYPLSSLQ